MKILSMQKNRKNIKLNLMGIKLTFRTKPKKQTTLSEIYDDTFYKAQAESSYQSGKEVLSLVNRILPNIKSVLDIGCGIGTWLKAWTEISKDIFILGVDGNSQPANLLYIPKKRLLTKDILELNSKDLPKKHFDLTQCLEVAEHLPQAYADNFVKTLTAFSDTILFSAALPHQGGHYHLNEQPLEYWNKKFKQHGYECFDILRTKIWENPNVCWWYRQNIVLYAKGTTQKYLKSRGYKSVEHLQTMYHPEYINLQFKS